MKRRRLIYFLGLMLAASAAMAANAPDSRSELPQAWGDWTRWGDQGDGTYRNPVLPADYSDIDCIRVGSDYYAISSTFQYSPGMVILHSKDLVNWTIVGHAITDLTQIGPELNWDRMNRYGKGVWAGAIRHAKGRFWIYFGTPDEGYFMTSDPSPTGPWEQLHPLMKSRGWDDCCPFWDDDGQGYFVGTHFADGYKTYLWRLTPDGKSLIEESRTLVNEGGKREANKLLKIKGWYYHFFSEVTGGVRVVMMQRSRSIMGPYTERRQLTALNHESHEPNQGGMVDTVNGDWFFFTHHGHGDWEGRPASLLPVTWVDGWPILGETDATGKPGLMSWGGKKLLAGSISTPQSSDDFSTTKLAEQWEWNYQPRADRWSLTARPGFLRLHAFRPLRPDDLMKAGNTLTQRSFRTASNCVVLKLDLSGLADGQKAGLCHFAKTHSALGVVQDGKVRRIEYREYGQLTIGSEITGDQLWLKSSWGLDGRSRYACSTDGKSFTDFGPEYQLSWGNYRGDRIGIYTFNTKQEAGHVDVDFLNYDYAGVRAGLGDANVTVSTPDVPTEKDMSAYLLVYFKDDTHSPYFALSSDGYSFTDVNKGQPIMDGEKLAEQKGIRDPHIMRGPDNAFYLAMTDLHIFARQKGYRSTEWERDGKEYLWGNNRALVLMKSTNLLDWSHTILRVDQAFPGLEDIGCAWAPETIYDARKGRLMIYFTMRFKNGKNRLYYAYVNDAFTKLETKPELLFQYPTDKNYIDADITQVGDKFHMFYVPHDGVPGIKQAVSDSINAGYVYDPKHYDPEPKACEAPNVWKRIGQDKWVLMYDCYGIQPHNFGFSETADFQNFTNLGRFNEGVMKATNFQSPKHGSVIQLTKTEADRLAKHWKVEKY